MPITTYARTDGPGATRRIARALSALVASCLLFAPMPSYADEVTETSETSETGGAVPQFGAAAQMFMLEGESTADNAKIFWNNDVAGADTYVVYRGGGGVRI